MGIGLADPDEMSREQQWSHFILSPVYIKAKSWTVVMTVHVSKNTFYLHVVSCMDKFPTLHASRTSVTDLCSCAQCDDMIVINREHKRRG